MSEPLRPGADLGGYRVIALLGAGAMGEVYLAQDRRLGRRVALKVLPLDLAADGGRRQRFFQEARSAAALQHPHIATLYEIGNDGNRDFLAIEHVDGQSLRAVLARGRLPLRQALEIAAQVADGLAAGHAAGVVHRDIKPDNLMITRDGAAKIIDFGLAKLVAQPPELDTSADRSQSATQMLPPRTIAGAILGTPAYMSPEQARGDEADARSDLFSLGAVLYEMVAGRRPFAEASAVEQLHAILTTDPRPVAELVPELPRAVDDILDRLLAKDPSRRYQHAGDLRLDLLRASERLGRSEPGTAAPRAAAASLSRMRRHALVGGALAALLAAAVAGGLAARRAGARASSDTRDLAATTLEQLTSDPGYEGEPTFAPDGESLAYVSDRSGNLEIYLKQIAGGPDINLTNDPADDVQPAFSPDGKQIAFVSSREGASALVFRNPRAPLMGGDIWVMAAFGGSPRRVARKGNFPAWTPDGSSLVFTAGPWRDQRVYVVSAQGGTPREVELRLPRRELFLFYPSLSPDGRWLLLEGGDERLYVAPAAGGEATDVATGGRPAWNADGTAILFSSAAPGHNFSLFEVPFAPSTGAAGKPRPLTLGRGADTEPCASRDGRRIAFAAQEVTFNIERVPLDEAGIARGPAEPVTAGNNVSYFFDVARDGTVIHQTRRGSGFQIWRSAPGAAPVQLTSDPRFACRYPRLSPDGSTIAFDRETLADGRHEVARMELDGGDPRPLFAGSGMFIEWHPSGTGLAHFEASEEQVHLWNPATGVSRPLTKETVRSGQSFSADGAWLIYQALGPDDSTDVHAVPLGGGDARVIVASPHEDFHPQASRDDRWLYFQRDHKNVLRVPGPAQEWRHAEPEVVTAFPESNLYLEDPQLSPDGKWLYFSRGRFASDLWVITLPVPLSRS